MDEKKRTITRIWDEWMKDKKKRIIIFALLGILLGCVVTALCVFCYKKGMDDGESHLQSARQVTIDTGKKPKKSSEVTQQAVTQEAASAEAVVTEQSVTPQAAQPDETQKQKDKKSAAAGKSSAKSGKNAVAASAFAGKLKVNGTQLCTEDGTPIQLRGVSTHGIAWFPQYVNEALFGEIRSWGGNTVRLAMYTAESNGYCTGDSANQKKLKQLIQDGVTYATRQNLYVIIDWHVLQDQNPNTYKAQAIAFFQEMSQKYKDNDHVIYEICNEPNGGVGWSDIKAYANEVIAAIRANDPDGVILVGTPNWSQQVDKAAADPIVGYDNIMYTLHFYAGTHGESLRNTMVQALQAGLPVFVSEFGICDASGNGGVNTQQADAWIQTLNQYGVSYVQWSLCNKNESASILQSGCSKTSGITEADLSQSGQWLLKTWKGTTAGGSSSESSTQQSVTQPQTQQQTQAGNADSGSGGSSQSTPSQSQSQKDPAAYAPSCSGGVQAVAVNSWQEGNAFCIQYEIQMANTTGSIMEGWSGSMNFPAGVSVVSGWNANFSASGTQVSFYAMDYNKTIQPGQTLSGIGCIVRIE